ncbi:MAG: NADH-quinone oxidoreductase subunit A [Actinomycetaceae bacterium]|nr:NADH-quinone oxidoreductase subunit A [Actinomycetaceae bacterium]
MIPGAISPGATILIMAAVTLSVALGGLVASAILSPNRRNRSKTATYECGIEPMENQAAHGRFPIKYYLVAMTFIVFDIEVVFIYPWAVASNKFDSALAGPALIALLIFIALITIPYVYEWRRGGLDF